MYFIHILGKFGVFSIEKCKVRTHTKDINDRPYLVLVRENGLTWLISPKECPSLLRPDHKSASLRRTVLKKEWLSAHKGEKIYGDDAERDTNEE